MTKEDYIVLAAALRNAHDNGLKTDVSGVNMAAFYVADALAADNPRFNRDTFLKAAGVK